MRSVWKGSINFGMVAIPAKLYTGSDKGTVNFHQYHSCGSRIQMPKWCPVCERKVEQTEISKGYEISKEEHIILSDAELDGLPLKSLKTIEVVQFINPSEIDIRAYDDCYLLSCEDVGSKAFALFLSAMRELGVVGIAKLGYREREHLSLVRPYDAIMLLQTLHYADELRPYDEIKPRAVSLSEQETELAQTLVKGMIAGFDFSQYHNQYKEALESMIEAKINGEIISTPELATAPTADLADALMQSLNALGSKL